MHSRIYYGWYIVVLTALVSMFVMGTTYSAFSLMVVPVSRELGLSRAEMNTGLVLMNLGSTLWAPFMGRTIDRLPIRPVMLVSGIVLGLCLAGLGISSSPLLSAVVLFFPLPLAVLGACTLTAGQLVGRWFVARRARALALSALGLSFAGLALTPVLGLLIAGMGWRLALVTAGAADAAIVVLAVILIRAKPGPDDMDRELVARAGMAKPVMAARDLVPAPVMTVLRAPRFWALAIANGIVVGALSSLAVSMVPLAIGSGISMPAAMVIVSTAGGFGIAGKLLVSVFADKVNRIVLVAAAYLASACVAGALFFDTGYSTLLACSAVLGLANGFALPTYGAVLAEQFGMGSFGTVRGLAFPMFTLLSAAALRFVGEVYDRTGSYEIAFATFFAAQVLAAALMLCSPHLAGPREVEAPAAAA